MKFITLSLLFMYTFYGKVNKICIGNQCFLIINKKNFNYPKAPCRDRKTTTGFGSKIHYWLVFSQYGWQWIVSLDRQTHTNGWSPMVNAFPQFICKMFYGSIGNSTSIVSSHIILSRQKRWAYSLGVCASSSSSSTTRMKKRWNFYINFWCCFPSHLIKDDGEQ